MEGKEEQAIPEARVPLGGDYWDAEPKAPVWGFADLHAHFMAHLAFGGNAFWGLPYDPALQIEIDRESKPHDWHLVQLGVRGVKIASTDICNPPLLRRAAETGLPLIVTRAEQGQPRGAGGFFRLGGRQRHAAACGHTAYGDSESGSDHRGGIARDHRRFGRHPGQTGSG